MIKGIFVIAILIWANSCSLATPSPQDVFKTSPNVFVQSFQSQENMAVVRFTTTPAQSHEIALSCDLPTTSDPEAPILDRLLTRIKDNFILIAASIALL